MSIQHCLATRSEFEPGTIREAELLRAGQAGDTAALEQLLSSHKRSLFTLCRGILGHAEDAEDAVQETFLRALRALPDFRLGRATVRTWLFRIAVNVSLNWKRDRRSTEPWEEDTPAAGGGTDSAEAIALCRLQLREALGALPRRQRAMLLLKVIEGWSVAEIAAGAPPRSGGLGWSSVRVKHELAKARRTLTEWQLHRTMEEDKP